MIHEAVLPFDVFEQAREHLLRGIQAAVPQEDLCFSLWRPGTGASRHTAIISEIVMPAEGERDLHGNVSFGPEYLGRSLQMAHEKEMGLALMHSHPSGGWQDLSEEDVVAERDRAAPPARSTGHPFVGVTMGSDGSLSARVWPKGSDEPDWCRKVRVAGGDTMEVTYNPNVFSRYERRDKLRRTIDSWGLDMQEKMARLKIGVVGTGSVGSVIAEMLARMGMEDLVLIDGDRVEMHNLDRLLHAGRDDIGRHKVRLVEESVRRAATAKDIRVVGWPENLQSRPCYEAALDCDLLFSCVDRPMPKDILNNIAYAHCIPVIFGGVHIANKPSGRLSQATWSALRIAPGTRCMRCDGQYSTSDVVQERDGTLDDPAYLNPGGGGNGRGMPANQNVISFSVCLAGLMVNEMVRCLIAERWWPPTGPKTTCRYITNTQESADERECRPNCEVRARTGMGDGYRYPFLESGPGVPTNRESGVIARFRSWLARLLRPAQ